MNYFPNGATESKPKEPSSFLSPERWLLQCLLRIIGNPPMSVVLWGGAEIVSGTDPPVARVRVKDRGTLFRLAFDPLYQFGEAYATGRVQVDGDLVELLKVAYRSINQRRTGRRVGLHRVASGFHPPRSTSLARSRKNIHHHYDISNDFYRLWLDDQLVYTCAYFAEPSWSLERAQRAKMDHVCRKLRLQPGDAVLEAGCGWGALARHMARNYDVKVKAFNISGEQILYARERARREGLQDCVEFIEDDWRNMNDKCDAFVSVGMMEHVGRRNYAQLGDVIHRCLHPKGRGLIHTIGQNFARPLNPWIERRVFPGAYPPSLREALQVFEPHGFSVLDVENLRLHYAETLRHWLTRFEDAREIVGAMFDERFVRMWRMYLSGSIAAFETGSLQLFQLVFAPGTSNDVPRTREDRGQVLKFDFSSGFPQPGLEQKLKFKA